jgi:hypothetical protein
MFHVKHYLLIRELCNNVSLFNTNIRHLFTFMQGLFTYFKKVMNNVIN